MRIQLHAGKNQITISGQLPITFAGRSYRIARFSYGLRHQRSSSRVGRRTDTGAISQGSAGTLLDPWDGSHASGHPIAESRDGNETADLIIGLIAMNALNEGEIRNSLAILRAAFKNPKQSWNRRRSVGEP